MNLIGKETLPTLTKWEIYELERQDYSEGNNYLNLFCFTFRNTFEVRSLRLQSWRFQVVIGSSFNKKNVLFTNY